jgi:cytochrome c biogenesis protein CcmG/thiol:disulfide interchange protein DsbE
MTGWAARRAAWLKRLRSWATFWNLVTLAVVLWAVPRLLPHLGAVVGVESGPQTMPQFRYTSLDGVELSADSLRGKVVLVNFWATWCTPCRVEMPALDRMHRRHAAEGFVVVGLAMDRASTAQVRAFVEERGVHYPIAHVGPEAELAFGGVRGYPTSFLLDRTGRVRHTVIGPVAPLSLEPAVRRLLAESAAERISGAPDK